jgi:transcriptional regulator with XRE-family HTH domain
LNGKSSPTLRSMSKLAQTLGVTVRDLLPGPAKAKAGKT